VDTPDLIPVLVLAACARLCDTYSQASGYNPCDVSNICGGLNDAGTARPACRAFCSTVTGYCITTFGDTVTSGRRLQSTASGGGAAPSPPAQHPTPENVAGYTYHEGPCSWPRRPNYLSYENTAFPTIAAQFGAANLAAVCDALNAAHATDAVVSTAPLRHPRPPALPQTARSHDCAPNSLRRTHHAKASNRGDMSLS